MRCIQEAKPAGFFESKPVGFKIAEQATSQRSISSVNWSGASKSFWLLSKESVVFAMTSE
jgi:hypothetical protein